MDLFKRLFGRNADPSNAAAPPAQARAAPHAEQTDAQFWQQVYAARKALFEQSFGTLPRQIQKMHDLLGIWPGGGLYSIATPHLGTGVTVYASFGLTNPDMPTQLTVTDLEKESDGVCAVRTQGTVARKHTLRPSTAAPGYGYEIIVLAKDDAQWPWWLLQWAVKAELIGDADLVARVQQYQGLTVEQIEIGESAPANILIAKARAPLLTELALPNGRACLLVATVITDAEMQWSKEFGREALLEALCEAGVGQFSVLERSSVVSLPAVSAIQDLSALRYCESVDFSAVTSYDQMLALAAAGSLQAILLFPEEFGGEASGVNLIYVPPAIAELKDRTTASLRAAFCAGHIDTLKIEPEYKGDSFVAAALHIHATHSSKSGRFVQSIEIW